MASMTDCIALPDKTEVTAIVKASNKTAVSPPPVPQASTVTAIAANDMKVADINFGQLHALVQEMCEPQLQTAKTLARIASSLETHLASDVAEPSQHANEITTGWESGVMVVGAARMGEDLLAANQVTETLADTFVIDLGNTRQVTGLFLHLKWPSIDETPAPLAAVFEVEMETDHRVVRVKYDACAYGLRVNTENTPWRAQKIKITMQRPSRVGNAVLDKYVLCGKTLTVRCVPMATNNQA